MVDPFETALKALLSDKLAEYVDVEYYGAVDAPSATVGFPFFSVETPETMI